MSAVLGLAGCALPALVAAAEYPVAPAKVATAPATAPAAASIVTLKHGDGVQGQGSSGARGYRRRQQGAHQGGTPGRFAGRDALGLAK